MASVYNEMSDHLILDMHRIFISCERKRIEKLLPILYTENCGNAEELRRSRNDQCITLIHLASYDGRLEMLKRADALEVDVYITDQHGRSALHYAASQGQIDVVRWFVQCSMTPDKLQRPDTFGMTALHLAVESKRVDIVRLLVDAGVDVNIRDRKNMTPLHLAWVDVRCTDPEEMSRYEDIVDILLGSPCFRKFVDEPIVDTSGLIIDWGTMVLNCAVRINNTKVTKQLLEHGLHIRDNWPVNQKTVTALHIAADNGYHRMLRMLLDYHHMTSWMINMRDKKGQTPLHVAVIQGELECAKTLINNEGNLASMAKNGNTVIDTLLQYNERPIDFLTEILDTGVFEMGVNCNTVNLNFQALAPRGKRQMAVVSSLIRAVSSMEQMKILQHPLIEAFLALKWTRLRYSFFILVAFQVLFSVCLFAYGVTLLQEKGDAPIPRRILFVCACILLCNNALQLFMIPKYYAKQFETWFSTIGGILCFIVAIAGEFSPDLMASANLASPDQDLHCGRPRSWISQSISIAILFACVEIMFLVGRFPTWGYYALMFSAVLKNVLKVFIAVVWIIIGFSLSFLVLFHGNNEFDNPWRAFAKTVVMMMGEYEYSSLFSWIDEANATSNQLNSDISQNIFLPITSRIIFLVFVMLASIVLLNLMIGLAVTDIQGLLNKGLILRLLKQADFVTHLEQVTSHWMFRSRFVPKCVISMLESRNRIPTQLDLRLLGRSGKHPRGISEKLVEKLFDLASKNRHRRWKILRNSVSPNEDGDNLTETILYLQEAVRKLHREKMRMRRNQSPIPIIRIERE